MCSLALLISFSCFQNEISLYPLSLPLLQLYERFLPALPSPDSHLMGRRLPTLHSSQLSHGHVPFDKGAAGCIMAATAWTSPRLLALLVKNVSWSTLDPGGRWHSKFLVCWDVQVGLQHRDEEDVHCVNCYFCI